MNNTLVSFSPFHAVSEIEVLISPDPNQKEVYKQGGSFVGENWVSGLALTNVGLAKLMNAAGIRETKSVRMDDRAHPHICAWQFSAEWVQPDSTVLQYSSDYELDLRDYIKVGEQNFKGARFEKAVQDERVAVVSKKCNVKGTGEAKIQACDKAYAALSESDRREVDEIAEAKALRYIVQMRQFIVQRAQTGAMERVIRKMLSLKSAYTAEELKVPFRVPRSRWDWDRVDAALGQQEGRQLRELQAIQLLGIQPAQWQEFKKLSAPEPRVSEVTEGEIIEAEDVKPEVVKASPAAEAIKSVVEKLTLTTGQKQTEGKDPKELVGKAITQNPLKDWFMENVFKTFNAKKHYENHIKKHFNKESVANLTWGQFGILVDHVVDKLPYPSEYSGEKIAEKQATAVAGPTGLANLLEVAGVWDVVNSVLLEKNATLVANEVILRDLLAALEAGVFKATDVDAIKDHLSHEVR